MAGNVRYYGGGVFSKTRGDGKEVFYVRYWYKGKQIKERVGLNLEAARGRRELRRMQIDEGTFKSLKDRTKSPTFREFAQRFMRDYGSLRRSAYYKETMDILFRYFGERKLASIKPKDLDQFRARREADFERRRGHKISDSTMRKNLTVLATMFKMAVRWGLLEVNPAAGLEKPAEPHHRIRYLTRDEWRRLEEQAPPWLCPIITLAVSTGMRRKEITNLCWDDVDFERRLIYVSENNKTGLGRYIPMNDTVRALLESQRRRDREVMLRTEPAKIIPYVFVDGTGKPYTAQRAKAGITEHTREAAKRAGLKDFTFHDLRHTAGSWMAQAGVPMQRIGKVLGHKDLRSTQQYAHLAPEHLREAVAVLEIGRTESI